MRSKRRHAESLLKKLAMALGIPIQITCSEKGKRLEQHTAQKCRRLGFQVIDDSKKRLSHDLRVNGFRVQCKNRSKHGGRADGVYLFKNSQKKYTTEEVDFFVIRLSRKCYVIPSSQIADSDGFVARYVPLNKKRHYINAWYQLAGEKVAVDVQASLFAEVKT